MSLYIASLNSGSNGNCYYISNRREAVLVDAGISCRETERRMRGLGLSMQEVKAIFISHEHGDHIRGVETLAKKYQLPVYITQSTLQYGRLNLATHLIKNFNAFQAIMIGGLAVIPFPKLHDAAEPHSFLISGNETNIGVFTDIGAPCEHVVHHFRQCHAAFLEANYDESMLENGAYPYHLKKRIRGGKGHLSNTQALDMFKRHKPEFMSHIFLSHLSRDNNSPELVEELFRRAAGPTEVVVASRYEASKLYHIQADGAKADSVASAPAVNGKQASLFW